MPGIFVSSARLAFNPSSHCASPLCVSREHQAMIHRVHVNRIQRVNRFHRKRVDVMPDGFGAFLDVMKRRN